MTKGGIAAIQHGLSGGMVLHGGQFQPVDAHYYSSRAWRQWVSINFVTHALTRVLLGFLKMFAELNSMRIAHGSHWLPVITVSTPGRE